MRIKAMLAAIILAASFLPACDNKMSTVDDGGEEIFLKEFKGSQQVMGARIYFQGKSDFHVKAIVVGANEHPGLYPKQVPVRMFLLAPEELVLEIYPEGPEDLIEIIKSTSLTAGSRKAAEEIAYRFEQINKKKLDLSFIPKDAAIKEKLYSIRKGDIIEVEGFRGNLLIGTLGEKEKKSIWCPEFEKNRYVYVKRVQILDSF